MLQCQRQERQILTVIRMLLPQSGLHSYTLGIKIGHICPEVRSDGEQNCFSKIDDVPRMLMNA